MISASNFKDFSKLLSRLLYNEIYNNPPKRISKTRKIREYHKVIFIREDERRYLNLLDILFYLTSNIKSGGKLLVFYYVTDASYSSYYGVITVV